MDDWANGKKRIATDAQIVFLSVHQWLFKT
jgi:hypothetical protein